MLIDNSNANLVGVSDDGSHGIHGITNVAEKTRNRYITSVDGGIGLSQR